MLVYFWRSLLDSCCSSTAHCISGTDSEAQHPILILLPPLNAAFTWASRNCWSQTQSCHWCWRGGCSTNEHHCLGLLHVFTESLEGAGYRQGRTGREMSHRSDLNYLKEGEEAEQVWLCKISVSVPRGISTPRTGSPLAARRESLGHIKPGWLQSVTRQTPARPSNQGRRFADLPARPASPISISSQNHLLPKRPPRQGLAVPSPPVGADEGMSTWETIEPLLAATVLPAAGRCGPRAPTPAAAPGGARKAVGINNPRCPQTRSRFGFLQPPREITASITDPPRPPRARFAPRNDPHRTGERPPTPPTPLPRPRRGAAAPPGGRGAPCHVPSASGDGAAAGAGGAGGAGGGAGHAAAAGMSRPSVPGLRGGLRAAGRTRDPRRSLRETSHPGRAARGTGGQAKRGWGGGRRGRDNGGEKRKRWKAVSPVADLTGGRGGGGSLSPSHAAREPKWSD